MKRILTLGGILSAIASLACPVWAGEAVKEPQGGVEERIPLIVLDNVPLTDAIRGLARQMDLNFIFDPRILDSSGTFPSEPALFYRWENLSAEKALKQILKDHALKLVPNPATSVARITGTNNPVMPVTTNSVGTDTRGPIPIVQVDGMPVSDAIKLISKKAGLNIVFAPDAQTALDNPGGSRNPAKISIRWENITPRRALAALLDNYDLVLNEDATKSVAQIALKKPSGQRGIREKSGK